MGIPFSILHSFHLLRRYSQLSTLGRCRRRNLTPADLSPWDAIKNPHSTISQGCDVEIESATELYSLFYSNSRLNLQHNNIMLYGVMAPGT
ncbi:hypothetical protein IEQ34_007727 [Dendrobium chrysotoxum]|uniref:Uncharacterized protein n=1 Tax=Dendrobium chrysotoxum TaxID=161865 RepID=A0AAV7H6J4_DENCH|nr:hypothetical protein IEQ34_007727 [Dendrobium chrysotoxum]